MIENLKPEPLRQFWNDAVPYTTFAAAAVSAAGFVGALFSVRKINSENGNVQRYFSSGVLSLGIAATAGYFGHDNLHSMQKQTDQ